MDEATLEILEKKRPSIVTEQENSKRFFNWKEVGVYVAAGVGGLALSPVWMVGLVCFCGVFLCRACF